MDATADVPSFAPQLQSLGGVIDNFTRKRMELEREQRQQRAQEARDAYYQRKMDSQERRDTMKERGERVKFNAAQHAAAVRSPGSGPMLWHDEQGNLHTVQPRFIKGKSRQPTQPAPAQQESETTEPMGLQLREPELRVPGRRPPQSLQLRAPDVQLPEFPTRQEEPPPPASGASVVSVPQTRVQGAMFRQRPSTFFVDAIEDGEVQALPGPDEDKRVPMPQDAFPPGAREGQRYASEDVGEGGRKGNPFAEPIPPSGEVEATRDRLLQGPDSYFVDEVDEGSIQALPGPNENRRVEMPQDAFPPGAREGERYAGQDVGTDGRKGNPFAEPLPAIQGLGEKREALSKPWPEDGPLKLDQPGAKVTSVPPTRVEGARFDNRVDQADPFESAPPAPQEPEGDRWVYDLPDGRQIVVDLEQQRQARRADAESKIELAYEAMGSAPSPREKMFWANEIASLRGQLGDRGTRQLQQFSQQTGEREGRQQWQDENREDVQGFQGEQNDLNRANRLEAAAMKRRKSERLGRGVTDTTGSGSAWQRLDPKLQARFRTGYRMEENGWARRVNWDKLEGVGVDRLNLADVNISADGPYANTQWVESMMNFFGYIRGGVPAENETKEWRKSTTTLKNTVNSIGQYFSVPGLWDRLSGSDPDEATKAFENISSRMTPQQRQELTQAIRESRNVVQNVGAKNVDVLAERFEEEALPYREYVTAKANSFRSFLGLPQKQFYTDVPLKARKVVKGEAGARPTEATSVVPAGPGPTGSSTKSSDPARDALEAL